MSLALKKDDRKYTYSDYLTWNDEERWEIIDGVAYNMSPAPSRLHQEISAELFGQIWSFLKDKPCRVYASPFDVRLPKGDNKDDNIKNVVQPDIVVVCDKAKLDDKGCKGSPDMIVEIISPSTASMDYIKKLELYEISGVGEYWIVHPVDKIVLVFKLLADGKYGKPGTYSAENKVGVGIFEGELVIDLEAVFREE